MSQSHCRIGFCQITYRMGGCECDCPTCVESQEEMRDIPCPCGQTHQFSSPDLQEAVDRLVQDLGPEVSVVIGPEHKYLVNRYYIAFHGFSASEAEELAEKGVIKKVV